MKTILYFIFFLLISFAGCKPRPPFKTKSDLIGNWNGEFVQITTPSNLHAQFPVKKYGFASFALNKDDSYFYNLAIIRDVVLDKNILGNNYSKLLVRAVYRKYQTGQYAATDSTLSLFNDNGINGYVEKYFFEDRTLFTKYIDENKNTWLISWQKDND